jgi:hypothetical protein
MPALLARGRRGACSSPLGVSGLYDGITMAPLPAGPRCHHALSESTSSATLGALAGRMLREVGAKRDYLLILRRVVTRSRKTTSVHQL